MIRADFTPLWAADSSTIKALGPAQLRCLQLLRDRGPMTRRELRQAGISRRVLDPLFMTGYCYPALVYPDGSDPRRYCLAGPLQQLHLDRALAALAAHPGGITWDQLQAAQGTDRWSDAVVWHVYGAGLARYQSGGPTLFPAAPGEQQLILPAALKTAGRMAADPLGRAA